MASVNGATGRTLTPAPKAPPSTRVAPKEETVQYAVRERCACCNAALSKGERQRWAGAQASGGDFDYDSDCCKACNAILSCSGPMQWSYGQALGMIERVRSDGFVMVMKSLHLGDGESSFDVDFADVFKPARIGSEVTEQSSKERSKARLTIDILLANRTITLWAWGSRIDQLR